MIHTTYQLRGYLSKSGYARLDNVLRQCSVLYNAGLQEWRDAYSTHMGWEHLIDRETGKRVRTRDDKDWVYIPQRAKRVDAKPPTYYDQLKEFTGVRADDACWNDLDVNIGRGVLQRLERAKNAFFRRIKSGDKPGYPRFKSGRRWRTIEMAMVRPGMVKNGQVKIKGLPPIDLPSKRELPPSADLKTLRITRAGRRVMVSLGYQVEREPLPHNTACVGIDLGVTDRMVLSTGQIMMAGGDTPALEPYPAAGPDPAEIPTSGTPISTITAQGVASDVVESPRVTAVRAGAAGVASDVVESPQPRQSGPNPAGVASDVVESPVKRMDSKATIRVASDVVESPLPHRQRAGQARVASDVVESPIRAESKPSGLGVASDAVESPPSHKIKRRRVNRLNIAKKQQRLARCQRGSRERRKRARILANAHSRAKISNRNECHRITTNIIQRFGHIGIEALQIRNMTRSAKGTAEEPGKNVAAKSGLNREILTQTWGLIRQQLSYKAEWAGRQFVEVDPKYTSQACSRCGVIDAASRDKKDRKNFTCRSCGHQQDADVNAAINILRRSLAGGKASPLAFELA